MINHQTWRATSKEYQNGEAVYCKYQSENEWRGPNIILGTDSKQILMKHGESDVRVTSCHLPAVHQKSHNMCQDFSTIISPLSYTTDNSSSVFPLHKNCESSDSDCFKENDYI